MLKDDTVGENVKVKVGRVVLAMVELESFARSRLSSKKVVMSA